MSDLYDEIVNTTPGSGTELREKVESFNTLVNKYAGYFGIDIDTETIDIRAILSAPVDPDTGKNKYNLTNEQMVDLEALLEDNNIEAFDRTLSAIAGESPTSGMSSGQIDQLAYGLSGAIGQTIDPKMIEGLLGTLGIGGLDRSYEPKQGRKRIVIGEDGRPKPDPNNPGAYLMEPFNSHFTKDLHFFINDASSEADIREFQNYLIEHKAVSPDYFLGHEGRHSYLLESAITNIMNWFDTNRSVQQNTQEYSDIMNAEDIFFTGGQYYEYLKKTTGVTDGITQEEESPWAIEFQENMKYFNHAVQEYGKSNELAFTTQRAKAEEALIDQLKLNYKVPSPLQREQEVEDWFMYKLGRRGTKEEIAQWANGIAESYAQNFKEVTQNLLSMQDAHKQEEWAKEYMAGKDTIKSFDEMTDLTTELGIEDPVLREYDEREEAYQKEMDANAAATQKKEIQTMVLRMMLGK